MYAIKTTLLVVDGENHTIKTDIEDIFEDIEEATEAFKARHAESVNLINDTSTKRVEIAKNNGFLPFLFKIIRRKS